MSVNRKVFWEKQARLLRGADTGNESMSVPEALRRHYQRQKVRFPTEDEHREQDDNCQDDRGVRQEMQKLIFCYDGKSMGIKEWGDYVGVSYPTMQKRLKVMSIEEAVKMGRQKNGRKARLFITYKGEEMSIKELAKRTGMRYETLRYRICLVGMTPEEAVATDVRHWEGHKVLPCTYPDCDRCPHPDCVVDVV